MPDVIDHIHGCLVQHGHVNNRVYLMQFNPDTLRQIVPALDALADEKGYGKIIAKIPADAWGPFQAAGYAQEALIPAFFRGRSDALFVAKYTSSEREGRAPSETADRYLNLIRNPTTASDKTVVPVGDLTMCAQADAADMSAIYGRLFKSYPFPIQDPAYLKRSMTTGVVYCGIRVRGRLVSLAATEFDRHHQTAEMTDFATLPAWRGKGMAGRLLSHMEDHARRMQIKTVYSIARATSLGMNQVLKTGGYRYAGFLKNNTQIGGRIESMIVWYKRLGGESG